MQIVGWPKTLFEFSCNIIWKTQTNFLADPIYYFPQKKEVELSLCMIVLLKNKKDFSKTVLLNVHESLAEILQIQMHIVGPHLAKWFANMSTLVRGIPILNKQYKEVCDIDEIITEIKKELL